VLRSGGGEGDTVIVQLSDLHLREGADGDGPARRLGRAISRVQLLEPRPAAVLVSGDLVDMPSEAAYAQARELLAGLGLTVHAIPGNHDDRDLLRAAFAPGTAPAGAPVRFVVQCGELRLIGCDSTVPGAEHGELGAEQLDWLERTLDEAPDTPTLLALHHPPVLTGVRVMDAIALLEPDRAALEEIVERHRQVQALTCGHAHTTMSTSFAGRSLLICPSTNSALRLDLRPREDLPFAVAEQPLGFAVHALVDGRLVSHVQPFADAER
jgi:3',5'-cyclic-AMP phosphodiesterase